MSFVEASAERTAMHNDNVLKIGFFGTNCSSGRSSLRHCETREQSERSERSG